MNRPHKKGSFILVFLVLVLFFGQKQACCTEKIAKVYPDRASLTLGPYLSYLEDKEGILTINDILEPFYQKRFVQCKENTPGFGFTSSVYWFKFKLKNPEQQSIIRFLEIEYPLLDTVELFIPNKDGSYNKYSQGDRLPFYYRFISYRNFVFKIKVPPKKTTCYFLRIKTSSSLNVPVYLYSENGFIEKVENQETALGIYFGILLAMLAYNFILFCTIREWVYLYYLSFVVLNFLFQFSLTGMAFKYF